MGSGRRGGAAAAGHGLEHGRPRREAALAPQPRAELHARDGLPATPGRAARSLSPPTTATIRPRRRASTSRELGLEAHWRSRYRPAPRERPRRRRVPHHLLQPAVGGADGAARRLRRPTRHLRRPAPGGGRERRSRALPPAPRRGRPRHPGRGPEQGPGGDRHHLEPGRGSPLRLQRRGSDRPPHLLPRPPRPQRRGESDPRAGEARRAAGDLRDRADPRRRHPDRRLADGLADPQPDAGPGRRLGRRPRHHRRGPSPPRAGVPRHRQPPARQLARPDRDRPHDRLHRGAGAGRPLPDRLPPRRRLARRHRRRRRRPGDGGAAGTDPPRAAARPGRRAPGGAGPASEPADGLARPEGAGGRRQGLAERRRTCS